MSGRPSATPPAAPGRPTELVVARVHLRTGALGLARAELEALAGGGELDEPGLLDLAEARWRTGDLVGAGEAAQAYRSTGGDAALGFLIAAEAVAADGRPAEARQLAEQALEATGFPLDELFAGMPRSPIWPPAPSGSADGDASTGTEGTQSGAGPGTAMDAESHAPPRLPGPDPVRQLEAGRRALEAGQADRAAVHLAVALRFDPDLAPEILDLVPPSFAPSLDVLRGDAYRALDRDADARRAYGSAARAAEQG